MIRTLPKDQLKKGAQVALKNNPELKKVYVVSNGHIYYPDDEEQARMYAQKHGLTVLEITRTLKRAIKEKPKITSKIQQSSNSKKEEEENRQETVGTSTPKVTKKQRKREIHPKNGI